MKYCLSIANRNTTHLTQEDFVELRCDLMECVAEDVRTLVGAARRAIVTCHNPATAREVYVVAIECGTWGVDIDMTLASGALSEIVEIAKRRGVRVILSRHFDHTPPLQELTEHTRKAYALGADIAKIITTASTTAEALVPLELYGEFVGGRLVAFAMGEAGRFSRRLSLLRGAPYTYVSHPSLTPTVIGQPTREELERSLEGGFSLDDLSLPHTFTAPASKSEAQRSIVLATMAEGTTHLYGYTPCDDSEAALALARTLGARVRIEGSEVVIEGLGTEGMRRALASCGRLSVGESALLARLLIPIVGTLLPEGADCIIEGRGTLCGRILANDFDILRTLGATIEAPSRNTLPVRISGTARGVTRLEIDGSHSSQTTSGWLVALATTGARAEIVVHGAVSRPYVRLTADMLTRFGVEVEVSEEGDVMHLVLCGDGLKGAVVRLNGDWSSAGYFAAAYAIAQSGRAVREQYRVRCASHTHQPDERLIDLLCEVGAQIRREGEEMIFLPSEPLCGFCFDATECPDLLPTLAVVALYAVGTSRLGGLWRLTNKESNRTEALVESLVALGARVRIEGDELVIEGGAELCAAPLLTHSDHRMAMALTVAGLFMPERPRLDSGACVRKSFPAFFEILGNKTK